MKFITPRNALNRVTPIGHPIAYSRRMGLRPWTPSNLFAQGEVGAWYDPSDFTTMFQDSAGTIPVTAVGQTVGKILDKSGHNNHATQITAGLRPTLAFDADSAYFLNCAGTKWMVTPVNMNMSSTAKISVFSGLAKNTDAVALAYEFGTDTNSVPGSFGIITSDTFLAVANAGLTITSISSSSFPGYKKAVLAQSCDVPIGDITLRTNTVITHTDLNYGSSNFGNLPLYIGSRAGALIFNGGIYSLIIRSSLSNGTDTTNAEQWVAGKMNISIPLTYTNYPSTFLDTRTAVYKSGYYETSPFARSRFLTNATSITIGGYSSTYTDYGVISGLGIVVNDVFQQNVVFSLNNGISQQVVSFAPGNKIVDIVAGFQSTDGTISIGTFPVSFTATSPMTQLSPAPTSTVTIYGDSITNGIGSTTPTKEGWTVLMRGLVPKNIAVEGAAERQLFMDCSDGTKRAAFVAKIQSYNPAGMWIAIGVNDYSLSVWSAVNFGVAYLAMLDALHAAMPSLLITCQSMLVTTAEGPNTFGDTLQSYRNQVSSASAARPSFTTFVDGTLILTTADLTGGLHPTTAGYVKYANYVKGYPPFASGVPVNTVAPVVTGTPAAGNTLTCSQGTWSGAVSYAYQWYDNGAPIVGKTASTYLLTNAEKGFRLSCIVRATNANGQSDAISNVVQISLLPYSGSWIYQTPVSGAIPTANTIVHANNTVNRLNISDINSSGQSVDFSQLIAGNIITINGFAFTVQAVPQIHPGYASVSINPTTQQPPAIYTITIT